MIIANVKRKRRILSGLISLVIALFVMGTCFMFAGCSTPANDENTLTIIANDSNVGNDYIQRIFSLYEEKTGKDLNIIVVKNTEYQQKIEEMMSSDDQPDIVMLFNNALMRELGGTEDFMDLSGQPWIDELTENAKAYASDDAGALLGLPFWESSISGCYYNKTILEEIGLRPATNQAEFDKLCSALSAVGHTPICIGHDGCYSVYQFGIDPIVADNPDILEKLNSGELLYSDIPEVVNMVKWMKNAYDSGWFGDTDELKYGELGEVMGKGDAAMLFAWDTWFDTDFVPGKYTKDDFALMPVFIGTEDAGTYEGGNLNMFTVNKNSQKKELALDFLEFCATPENYNEAFDGISTVSVFKNETTNVESPMVTEMKDSIEEKERVSTAEPKIKGYNARMINDAIHQLYKDEITVEECLTIMDNSLK